MMTRQGLPADLSPLNLKAYFFNALGACGCSAMDEMHATVLRLLEWHDADGMKRKTYSKLFPEVGVFYLLAGLLDNLGLAEHGIAIRVPWLTEDGKRLLAALKAHDGESLENAHGKAYDGIHYD